MLPQLVNIVAVADKSSGISALGIDPLAILAQATTFLVLFFIINKFALKKIVATLEERRKTINRGLHLTSEMDKLKQELDARVESALHDARVESDKIIADAHSESGEIIKASEVSASSKAEMILRDAEARIEREIELAKRDLKKEMVELVSEVTASIMREKVTDQTDKKLIEKYLQEVQ